MKKTTTPPVPELPSKLHGLLFTKPELEQALYRGVTWTQGRRRCEGEGWKFSENEHFISMSPEVFSRLTALMPTGGCYEEPGQKRPAPKPVKRPGDVIEMTWGQLDSRGVSEGALRGNIGTFELVASKSGVKGSREEIKRAIRTFSFRDDGDDV